MTMTNRVGRNGTVNVCAYTYSDKFTQWLHPLETVPEEVSSGDLRVSLSPDPIRNAQIRHRRLATNFNHRFRSDPAAKVIQPRHYTLASLNAKPSPNTSVPQFCYAVDFRHSRGTMNPQPQEVITHGHNRQPKDFLLRFHILQCGWIQLRFVPRGLPPLYESLNSNGPRVCSRLGPLSFSRVSESATSLDLSPVTQRPQR